VVLAVEQARHAAFTASRARVSARVERIELHGQLVRSGVKIEMLRFNSELQASRSIFGFERERAGAANVADMSKQADELADELQTIDGRLTQLRDTYEQELAQLHTDLAASKHEAIRYTLGYLVSIASFGVVVMRYFS
jgi:hypothetical protein